MELSVSACWLVKENRYDVIPAEKRRVLCFYDGLTNEILA